MGYIAIPIPAPLNVGPYTITGGGAIRCAVQINNYSYGGSVYLQAVPVAGAGQRTLFIERYGSEYRPGIGYVFQIEVYNYSSIAFDFYLRCHFLSSVIVGDGN